jgi:Flp pilus assembly protein TadG
MRNFWHDRKGNVAILFALAIVPVMGAMGAALDYSRANAYRTDMQKAADATALALSKVMPLNETKLNEVAKQYFAANMGNHDLTNLSLEVTPGQGSVQLAATGNYVPVVAGILGVQQFEIGVSATARWGIGKVEVALVLDNSGSMGSLSRMTHLKAAAHNLINVLESSAVHPGDAKVAIVPFDSAVRVNYTQANAPAWVKWGSTGTCSILPQMLKSQSSCTSWGGVWSWDSWTSTKWNSWAGCLEDRDYSVSPNVENDVLDTAPNATTSMSTAALRTRYPAKPCDNNKLRRVTPLTEDWAALRSEITAMEPAGWTNIAIGMAWGWHVLSPTELYTEGKAYNTEDLTKYIILMTDGDNTRSRHSNDESFINQRTSAACTNIKESGIQIYSIRLVQGNADLIRNCATKPSMYYDVQNASNLAAVFSQIASQIASLHLSK